MEIQQLGIIAYLVFGLGYSACLHLAVALDDLAEFGELPEAFSLALSFILITLVWPYSVYISCVEPD